VAFRELLGSARAATFAAGALPIVSFPRPGLDWLAWVALVPGLLLIRAAQSGREAAIRGWCFGAGYWAAAGYWLLPDIGPGVALAAFVFGALWAGWGFAAWKVRSWAALVVVPSAWTAVEFVRSWHSLGGPWALLGASQWHHPAELGLAAIGGVWLVGFAVVEVNTALVLLLTQRSPMYVPAVVAGLLAGPITYALTAPPASGSTMRVALVQVGVIHDPAARLDAALRITAALPPGRLDLVVWGESSVGFDLDRSPGMIGRLESAASRLGADLLVNVDAQDALGRISKTSILIGPSGIAGRYTKTLLVPFGEYIPFRPELGWLTGISRAARQDRVPGTGVRVLQTGDLTFGPLVCFEATFPDLGRAEVLGGARMIVYQSAMSSFQGSWALQQQASLGAVRAAETGRPVVQAALSGVSAGFDSRGRLLAWLDSHRTGALSVTLTLPPSTEGTLYDRFGDYVPYLALAMIVGYSLSWYALSSWKRTLRTSRRDSVPLERRTGA
jgi:apolipoprotein N-acyltransferase